MANEFKVRKGLIVQGSGSTGDTTILDVQGNQGQLFSITDSLSGSLFSVGDISGIPILEVFSNEIVKIGTFNSEGIIVNGSNVTSSGNISASGNIFGNEINAADSFAKLHSDGKVEARSIFTFGTNSTDGFIRNASTAGDISIEPGTTSGILTLKSADTTALIINNQHVTASGNISGSSTSTLTIGGAAQAGSYKIAGATVLQGSTNLTVGSSGATGTISLTTHTSTPFKIEGDDSITISSHLSSSAAITASDSQFGSGGKIEITHSGGAGIIDNKTANLNIKTSANERISLSPAGAESLTVAHGGNVGIGTNSPSEKLQVNGNVAISGSNATLQLREGSAELYKFTATGTSLDMTVDSTNAISIFQAGQVGIGTTTPPEKLTVQGNISASGELTIGGELSLPLGDNIRFGNQLAILKESNGELKFFGGTNSTDGGFEFFTWNGSSYDSSFTLKNDRNATFVGTVTSAGITASGNISSSGTITANSFVGTFSGAVTGDATGLTGTPDITVGNITATSINTINITSSIVTASIVQTSGSNIFGDEITDTHTFNGSITASGNISASGNIETNKILTNAGDLIIQNTATDKDIIFKSDNGSGGTTAYITLDGSNTRTNVHQFMRFDDSIKAEFGDSADLQIFHDSTHGQIVNNSNNLFIKNNQEDGDIVFQSDDGSGTGVETYLTIDGSARTINFGRHTFYPDGFEARFGTDNDFKIVHDGSDTTFTNEKAGADIKFLSGSTEFLRFDGGSTKTIVSKELQFLNNISARFGTSNNSQIYHDAAQLRIDNSIGDIDIFNFANNKDISFFTDDGTGSTTEYLRFDGGDVSTIIFTPITASSNISASGTIFTNKIESPTTLLLGDPDGNTSGARISVNQSNNTVSVFSADLVVGQIGGAERNLNVTRHITASGNISASGELSADTIVVGSTLTHIGDSNTKITFSTDDINLTVAGKTAIDLTYDGDGGGDTREITFNEGHADIDVRIEGDTDANLFFTDAGNEKVGIGTNSPGEKLEVVGNISASGTGSFAYVTASYDVSADNQVAAGVYFRARTGFRLKNYDNTWNAMEMLTNGKLQLASGGNNDRGHLKLHADHGASPRTSVIEFQNEAQAGSFLFTDASQSLKFHTSDPGEDDSVGYVVGVPKVEMLSVTSSTLNANTLMTLPNSLTYKTSTDGYEYLEVFADGIRLNRTIDYAEVDTSSVRFLISIPSQSIITYKSLRTV